MIYYQYGFQPKHSTIHPILHLLNHCAEANNKPKSEDTLAVFCDLSKAFDVIDHKILLHKLRAYGLRGIVNTWFENYLTGRTQFVRKPAIPIETLTLWCPSGFHIGTFTLSHLCK